MCCPLFMVVTNLHSLSAALISSNIILIAVLFTKYAPNWFPKWGLGDACMKCSGRDWFHAQSVKSDQTLSCTFRKTSNFIQVIFLHGKDRSQFSSSIYNSITIKFRMVISHNPSGRLSQVSPDWTDSPTFSVLRIDGSSNGTFELHSGSNREGSTFIQCSYGFELVQVHSATLSSGPAVFFRSSRRRISRLDTLQPLLGFSDPLHTMAGKCVHKGCGKTFADPEEACVYHPGPPVFHEGQKGKDLGATPSH